MNSELKDLKEKLNSKKGEVKKVRSRLTKRERDLEHLQAGLTHIVKHVMTKDYEAAVKDLYNKLIKKSLRGKASASEQGGGVSADQGVIAEVNRQRDYMEQTCHTLKRTVKLAKEKMKKANKIAMQQNSFLITECNNLRHENLKVGVRDLV